MHTSDAAAVVVDKAGRGTGCGILVAGLRKAVVGRLNGASRDGSRSGVRPIGEIYGRNAPRRIHAPATRLPLELRHGLGRVRLGVE